MELSAPASYYQVLLRERTTRQLTGTRATFRRVDTANRKFEKNNV